jgi:hypothetical protein
MVQRGAGATDGARAELSGGGAAAAVGQQGLDQLAVAQPTASQAGGAGGVQALLERAGAGDRRHQVAVDPVGQVRPGPRVPPLKHTVVAAPIEPDSPRPSDAGREFHDAHQPVTRTVTLGP